MRESLERRVEEHGFIVRVGYQEDDPLIAHRLWDRGDAGGRDVPKGEEEDWKQGEAENGCSLHGAQYLRWWTGRLPGAGVFSRDSTST